MISLDLLKDKNSKLDGKSSIFFKCKTKKRGLMATNILELEPSTGKLFWVEDSIGITDNFTLGMSFGISNFIGFLNKAVSCGGIHGMAFFNK